MHVEDRLTELEGKGTPGPWNTDKARGDDYPIVWAESALVAQTFGGCEDCASPEEARANADLIVALRNAAPVLLAVVRAARVIEHWQLDFTLDGSGRVPVDYHFLNALLTAVRELDETDVGELPEVEDL